MAPILGAPQHLTEDKLKSSKLPTVGLGTVCDSIRSPRTAIPTAIYGVTHWHVDGLWVSNIQMFVTFKGLPSLGAWAF